MPKIPGFLLVDVLEITWDMHTAGICESLQLRKGSIVILLLIG